MMLSSRCLVQDRCYLIIISNRIYKNIELDLNICAPLKLVTHSMYVIIVQFQWVRMRKCNSMWYILCLVSIFVSAWFKLTAVHFPAVFKQFSLGFVATIHTARWAKKRHAEYTRQEYQHRNPAKCKTRTYEKTHTY